MTPNKFGTFNSTVGLNLRVTGHCNQGGRKYMEDAFVAAYQQTSDLRDLEYAYFGIFDGHGGREASLFAKEHLMNNIVCQKSFWSDDDDQVLKAIKDGFLTTHYAMWREVGKWPKTVSGLPSTSGTTSSIGFIRRRKLYIGHVGDSKIVVGQHRPTISNTWRAKALTKDHKPASPEEKSRIESVGGSVVSKAGVARVVWNRPRSGHKGPIRRSTEFEQIPFLAVARSLGDLWSYNYHNHEFVVSPEPDVTVFELNPNRDKCIIFGTDGLWNMVNEQQAISIVQSVEKHNERRILESGKSTVFSLINPSKKLVDEALYCWFSYGMRADNTSVLIVMIDPSGPPKCAVLLKEKVMKRLRPRDEQTENENSKTGDSDSSSPSKEKKRSLETSDSSFLKDSKLCEPPCKERKLSSELSDLMPQNLPKPVILSPQKVKSKSSSPPKPSPDPPTSASPPSTDEKLIKKGHDPPQVEPSDVKNSENENELSVPASKPQRVSESGECSSDHCTSQENSKNNVNTNVLKNDSLAKSDSLVHSSSNSKETCRVHLCEVDNIFKLNNRTSDSTESKNTSLDLKKNNVHSPVLKRLKKSMLRQHDSKSMASPRLRRLRHSHISCRTRAQNNVRKLKV